VPYPIPIDISPAESPTLLLRTHPYNILPVFSLLFRYSYQYYHAVLFPKTFVWNQCAVRRATAHAASFLLLKAEARI
jgi:hypothetical protein